jgi:hypothetical protein
MEVSTARPLTDSTATSNAQEFIVATSIVSDQVTPSLRGEGLNTRRADGGTPEALSPQQYTANGWSIYGAQRAQPLATGGKGDAL